MSRCQDKVNCHTFYHLTSRIADTRVFGTRGAYDQSSKEPCRIWSDTDGANQKAFASEPVQYEWETDIKRGLIDDGDG